jgi:hypothetical protein
MNSERRDVELFATTCQNSLKPRRYGAGLGKWQGECKEQKVLDVAEEPATSCQVVP